MSTIGFSDIDYVQFGINSDEENLRNGFTEIMNDNLFTTNGTPVIGGVYDLRLGTTDHNNLCATCFYGKKLCTGHRGYLKMKAHVLQPIAISIIRQWLRVVCLYCGTLMADVEKLKKMPISKRMLESLNGIDGKKCPNKDCGKVHPKIRKDKEDRFTFWVVFNSDSDEPDVIDDMDSKYVKKLYPDTIAHIFKKISNSTVELLGKSNHPSKLVVKIIEIPPNTIRPGIKSFNGDGSSYHDSTNILQHIVKRNNLIPDELPDSIYEFDSDINLSIEMRDLDRSLQNLQQLYYDFILGSDSTSSLQGNSGKRGIIIGNRPVNSFLRNLPRKEGRIRNNLLGSRVFFNSRTTISGNVTYRIDEIGLPIEFAKVLQVEEYVQEYNIEYLTAIFLNGRSQYPGCTYVKKKLTGEMHDISKLLDSYLEIGDILYRDVVNGDYAYFNRMPTLTRSSLCVHKIKIIMDPSIHTFQINVLACELYNADFDGDQMHLTVARGIGQCIEASLLSKMPNLFISTQTSGPVNGQVQDSIIGAYEITRSNVLIDKYHTMGLFSQLNIPLNFDKYSRDHLFTGRDIISILLSVSPINYERTSKIYNELYKPYINYDKDEILIDIKNGKMLSGVLDSETIGPKSKGGLFHLISREYGPVMAIEQIFAMQQIAIQFLLWKGFTVCVGDLLLNKESEKETLSSVYTTILESELITKKLLKGDIIPPIDSTTEEFYELLQKSALQLDASEIFRQILSSINTNDNGFFKMILTGAKGKNPNLISIMSAIGPSIINGQRIQESFAFKRTSPYHQRFSTTPYARGFITDCYIKGMSSVSFIFQSIVSRFDLINKALSTAITGYFMRKGVMNNQSCITNNYRQVVKNDKIVQFIYGEDGLDSREIEDVPYRVLFMSDTELKNFITPISINAKTQDSVNKWFKRIKEDRDKFRKIKLRIESTYIKQSISNIITTPVNVDRLVDNVLNKSDMLYKKSITIEKINKVNDLIDNIPYIFYNSIQETLKNPISNHYKGASTLVRMLIRSELNPKIIENLSDEELDFTIKSIKLRYSKSLIDCGVAVGILASQSVSEPITQYMLDSHHRSVGAGTTKSGIVRIHEINSVNKIDKEQTPMMVIPINPNVFKNNKSDPMIIAQEIAKSIEYLTFRQFIASSGAKTLSESYKQLLHSEYKSDIEWINEFERTHVLNVVPVNLTKWCFRFVISKNTLVSKSIDLSLIVERLMLKHSNIYIVYTPETSEKIVMRMWYKYQNKKCLNSEDQCGDYMNTILNTPIRGVKRITQANVEKRQYYEVGADNSFVKKDNYVIITVGTNLYNITRFPKLFDVPRITSNSIPDTYDMYGIEAARSKIISETATIVEDSKVDIRHIYIHGDERSRTGRVTSIERGGLAVRENNNILLRASYQDPIKVIVDAALNNVKSPVYGIAANRLLGSVPKIGTFYNTLIVNEDFVNENSESVDNILNSL